MKSPLGIGDANSYCTNQYTDWNLARRHGCEFGIVRATTTGPWKDGKISIIEDVSYGSNVVKMAAAGVKRMPYAWFDPRVNYAPAPAQASAFLDTLDKYGGPGELGPMIDLEDGSGIYHYVGIGRHIKAWLDLVEAELKVKPRIYSNAAYIQAYLFNASIREDWLTDYGLVIANWGVNAPQVPQPWGPMGWDCWQYRVDAPGKYYGFYSQYGTIHPAPNMCMAVWNGQFPSIPPDV
jgi:GH25 family lysozyme M1 (1,4-beta-N-acetylmuramidase)